MKRFLLGAAIAGLFCGFLFNMLDWQDDAVAALLISCAASLLIVALKEENPNAARRD